MDPWLGILLFLAIAAAVLAGGYLAYRAAEQRRAALRELARELGWAFDPSYDTTHDDEYARFEIFRRGHSRAAYNTLRGQLEIDGRAYPAKMGDFTYKVTRNTGKSRSTTTYRFSYLIVHLPFIGAPDLLIRREGLLDKLAGAMGFDDIDFESAEFSRRFHVSAQDKRFAYDVVHPRMMEFLLASDAPTVDIERGRCCVADGARRWEPATFRARLEWVRRFFDLWPDHVTSDLEARNGI